MDYESLKKLAREYINARRTFIEAAKEFNELSGNDNIIGRIGELVAIGFLQMQNRSSVKNKSMVEEGFDLTTADGHKVSVKMITAENKYGRSSLIKQPWTELIIILLDKEYKVDRLGHITYEGYINAVRGNLVKEKLYTSKTLLADNGFFDQYGTLHKDESVLELL